jgi:GT2 family glycosyltransferase
VIKVSDISAVIPTYRREQVLINTLQMVINLLPAPAEILVIDQTEKHDKIIFDALSELNQIGAIRWIRLPSPSIPHAMNVGLIEATSNTVLFLDDDIIPDICLLDAHLAAHKGTGAALVAGRVIQSWQEDKVFSAGETFHFASTQPKWVDKFMGGNFSVQRHIALTLGGFDENFVHVAYRFEMEFAERLMLAGEKIFFEPDAVIHHLRVKEGGTRSYGEHLRTIKPSHAVGEYYYLLGSKLICNKIMRIIGRLFRVVRTKHHLRHPWWIPVTLTAELLGLFWAFFLSLRGQRLLGWSQHRGVNQ